jgi:catechol 2,3-dioxygenase-like lactoylglutathione lyase family enzyme
MALKRLDHYFIYSRNLDKSLEFYSNILGLESGSRPDFEFSGHWFYLDGQPVVHVGTEGFAGGYPEKKNKKKSSVANGTGRLDHVAFRADNIQKFVNRLTKAKIDFHTQYLKDFNLTQLFVKDPDGLTIELNFFDNEQSQDNLKTAAI